MSVKILFFGKLIDIIGTKELYLSDFKDIFALKNFLFKKYPELNQETIIITLNHEIIYENKNLKDGDEIAILPPVSGG